MQPLGPQAPNFAEKAAERPPIARNAIVGVVALKLAAQGRLLGRYRPVTMRPAPVTDFPQRAGEAVLGRLALHYPAPLPEASPKVSEPPQGKTALALRAALPSSRRAAKVHQAGLLRMQAQSVFGEALRQHHQHPPRVGSRRHAPFGPESAEGDPNRRRRIG